MKTTNPKGPDKGSAHVYRGGSWLGNADDLVVSYRYYNSPGYRYEGLGFRVVCRGRKE